MTDIGTTTKIDDAIDYLAEVIMDMAVNDPSHQAKMDGLGDQSLALMALLIMRELSKETKGYRSDDES